MEIMYDVFISYKSEERKEAIQVRDFLQANGLNCWMDQDQIKVGQDYKKEIAKYMPQCHAIIILISYISQKSKEVKQEYELAVSYQKEVFPIMIEDCILEDYYYNSFKHTQVSKTYWKSEQEKQKILRIIRDSIYLLKGEPVKTEEDFMMERIKYYQNNIIKEYNSLTEKWKDIIGKAIERCVFHTPEPHYMKSVLYEAIGHYQNLIHTYIVDIVSNLKLNNTLQLFYEFIQEYDVITKIWLSYNDFRKIVTEKHKYIKDSFKDEFTQIFILRIFKDYLGILNNEILIHPIVRLCKYLRQNNNIEFESFLSSILHNNNPAFINTSSISVFVDQRYIGREYCAHLQGAYDGLRNVFDPEEIDSPHWQDFLNRYCCDLLLEDLEERPGASTLIEFFIDNAIFTYDYSQNPERRGINYMYYYLINKCIQNRHPEYVKILLRIAGRVDWNNYVDNVDYQISRLKEFYITCMRENGYDHKFSLDLWRNA